MKVDEVVLVKIEKILEEGATFGDYNHEGLDGIGSIRFEFCVECFHDRKFVVVRTHFLSDEAMRKVVSTTVKTYDYEDFVNKCASLDWDTVSFLNMNGLSLFPSFKKYDHFMLIRNEVEKEFSYTICKDVKGI